jgi:ribose 5-phosphate isomerase B
MRIALSTDHAGFDQITKVSELVASLGHEAVSFGPSSLNSADDYPDFIYPAARAVAAGECDRGIIYGGSGQGEAIVANRVTGVRCAVFYGPAIAVGPIDASGTESIDTFDIIRLSRQHNDANMLSLGARFLAWPDIEKAVRLWLDTPFSNAERHVRRIHKIDTETIS